MKIKAKIRNASHGLLFFLKSRGLDPKICTKSIIITLPASYGLVEDNSPYYYEIPSALKNVNVEYVIEAKEKKESGIATIICGMRGGKFFPYYSPREKDGVSAHFSYPRAICSVTAYPDSTFVVMSHKIRENEREFLYIEDSIISQGKDFPQDFGPAIVAAIQKVNCNECQCIHFAN